MRSGPKTWTTPWRPQVIDQDFIFCRTLHIIFQCRWGRRLRILQVCHIGAVATVGQRCQGVQGGQGQGFDTASRSAAAAATSGSPATTFQKNGANHRQNQVTPSFSRPYYDVVYFQDIFVIFTKYHLVKIVIKQPIMLNLSSAMPTPQFCNSRNETKNTHLNQRLPGSKSSQTLSLFRFNIPTI